VGKRVPPSGTLKISSSWVCLVRLVRVCSGASTIAHRHYISTGSAVQCDHPHVVKQRDVLHGIQIQAED
jgi:hypothetical protein